MSAFNNTTVRVLKDVPLDSSYSDVIKFESAGAQASFFAGKAKYTYSNLSYQRVSSSVAAPRGPRTVRVPVMADEIYDCNYIMFQNNGGRWFYAFINSINYFSPENTEIEYEIDWYQTYQFDIRVLPSYVEREHAATDTLYANQVPEPIGSPDMICQTIQEEKISNGKYIVVGVSSTPDGKAVTGQMMFGIFSGVEIHVFTDAGAASSFIGEYADTGKLDSVVSVYMSPFNPNGATPNNPITGTRPPSIAGYLPRNNKLFQYPFVKMTLTNKQGDSQDFLYEDFCFYGASGITPNTIQFNVVSYGGTQPASYCLPVNYYNISGQGMNVYWEKVLQITGMPQCIWTGNAYANWLNSQGVANAMQNFTSFLSGTVNAVNSSGGVSGEAAMGSNDISPISGTAANVARGVQGTASNYARANTSLAIESFTRSKAPGVARGSSHGTALNFQIEQMGFILRHFCIKPEIAATIDDFFDMFGYATNRVKVPNMTGRQSWNYVKTKDVILTGSVPVQGMNRIKQMFNEGVRFWHGDFVGNYTLSNRCLLDLEGGAAVE